MLLDEYGLRPWDMERLTLRETNELVEWHNERVKAARSHTVRGGRRR